MGSQGRPNLPIELVLAKLSNHAGSLKFRFCFTAVPLSPFLPLFGVILQDKILLFLFLHLIRRDVERSETSVYFQRCATGGVEG